VTTYIGQAAANTAFSLMVAYMHLPFVLVIGPEAHPDHLRFLVSMLGVETGSGWRIAALFTTTEKVVKGG
jgi:hypothetical protein